MLDVVDNLLGDVAAGDFFDAESWRSVDLEHEWATAGTHQIDTSDVEAHGFGGFDGDALFFVGELDADAFPALVEITPKIIVERLAFHAGDNARADHKSTDVLAGGFLDVFLEEDVGALFVIEVEGLEGGFGRFFGLGENDAVAVSARGELDDDREADLLQKIVDISGVAGNESFWGVDAGFGEDLLGAELVAGAGNGDGARSDPSALHLKLADNRAAVASHIVGNTGDDGVVARESFAVVIDIGVLVVKREVAILVFDDANLETALLGFDDEALSRIIDIAIRENCDIHNNYIVPRKVRYVNIELLSFP